MSNKQALIDKLLSKSESDDWETAKKEWAFDQLGYKLSGSMPCPCGQRAREYCIIENRRTRDVMSVHAVCLRMYLKGVRRVPNDLNDVFAGYHRIKADPYSAPNAALIAYLVDKQPSMARDLSFLAAAAKGGQSKKSREKLRRLNSRYQISVDMF